MSSYLCIRKFHKNVSKMEQKKINMELDNGTPTADLRIEVPYKYDSLCVAVGTKIKTQGFTFQCVEQEENTPTLHDGSHTHFSCMGCAATFTLCQIMRCEARQRPDGVNVQFKVIARHE